MTILSLIILFVIIALVIWLVPGMPVILRNMLIAVGVIVFVIWLVNFLRLNTAL
jgi:hypothetical protein